MRYCSNHPGLWAPRRWSHSLVVALLGGVALLPIHARADGDTASRMRHSSGVVMMIGGMTNGNEEVPLAPDSRSAAARLAGQHDETVSLSVVIQPGNARLTTPDAPSGSVASRVTRLAPIVDEVARAAGMDSALLMAVIDVESGGNPQAVSPMGATGLMQLMPDTGAQHGASNLFDPRQNIAAGARYLHQLIHQFGDVQLALAAYNAGEGAVQKYGGQIPPYAETMAYVPKVMGRYVHYRNAGASTGEIESNPAMDAVRGRVLLVRRSGATAD